MLKFQTETDLPLSILCFLLNTLISGHHRIMEASESFVLFYFFQLQCFPPFNCELIEEAQNKRVWGWGELKMKISYWTFHCFSKESHTKT